MKDEEMAKDYANEYVPLIAPIDDRIYQVTKEDIIKILKDCSIDSYIDGLKAGRPKWHKVVDGDLPKENNLYLVAIKDNGLAIAYFNGLHWETKFNLGDFGHCLETVIAWCEIPKYMEG